jgi:hypothetical protein
MPTKLEKTVKREIDIDGQPFTVAISPDGLKITQKGFRKGQEVTWRQLWASSSADEPTGSASDTSSTSGGTNTSAFGGNADSGFR